jgi:hypothetical protein
MGMVTRCGLGIFDVLQGIIRRHVDAGYHCEDHDVEG